MLRLFGLFRRQRGSWFGYGAVLAYWLLLHYHHPLDIFLLRIRFVLIVTLFLLFALLLFGFEAE